MSIPRQSDLLLRMSQGHKDLVDFAGLVTSTMRAPVAQQGIDVANGLHILLPTTIACRLWVAVGVGIAMFLVFEIE